MRRIILACMLFSAPILAAGLNPASLASATVEFNATHTFTFIEEQDSRFERLTANLSWVPMTTSSHDADVSVENGEFRGDHVAVQRSAPEDFKTRIRASVDAERHQPRIEEATVFPLSEEAREAMRGHAEYLQGNGLIEITPRVKRTATQAAGEAETLRGVVDNVAAWTASNIDYNLSTTNAEASLPVSEVLDQGNGVCDEITNVFIAQLRSLGIPARYVSGVAYTESESFPDRWGAHGWAEVYFPGHGWVPYDPTYQQYGFVDASHVAFNKGSPEDKYGTSYEWRSRGVDVDYERSWSAGLVANASDDRGVSVAVRAADTPVGFDGYNRVEASVVNEKPYYQTVRVERVPTQGLSYGGRSSRVVTLSPRENASVEWRVDVDGEFNSGYEYTVPVVVRAAGQQARSSFMVAERASSDVDFGSSESSEASCSTGSDVFDPGEPVRITCDVDGVSAACVAGRCGEASSSPTLTVEAPNSSVTREVRLPDVGESAYVSIPLTLTPGLSAGNASFDTGSSVLSVSYDVDRAGVVDSVVVEVSDGSTVRSVPVNASAGEATVEVDASLGFHPSVSVNVVAVSGSEAYRESPVMSVVETRSWLGRVVDGVARTITSLNAS